METKNRSAIQACFSSMDRYVFCASLFVGFCYLAGQCNEKPTITRSSKTGQTKKETITIGTAVTGSSVPMISQTKCIKRKKGKINGRVHALPRRDYETLKQLASNGSMPRRCVVCPGVALGGDQLRITTHGIALE